MAGRSSRQTADRIARVIQLVTGFASAYGLELLATVHWIATQDGAGQIADAAALTQHIARWIRHPGTVAGQRAT
jgi:hypothetical protein